MIFKSGIEEQFLFNGAFYSSIELNTNELVEDHFKSIGSGIIKHLNSLSDEWETADNSRKNGLTYDIDNYEGTATVPRYLFEKNLSEIKIRDIFPDTITKNGIHFYFERIRIRFFNFGTGTITVRGHYKIEQDCSIEIFRSVYEQVSTGYADLLNTKITATIDEMKHVLGSGFERFVRNVDDEADTNIQWMHRIYYIKKTLISNTDTQKILLDLIPRFEPGPFINTSIDKNFELYPSIVGSVCIYDNQFTQHEWDHYARSLERIVDFQNSYWASLYKIDKQLFTEINGHTRYHKKMNIRDLNEKRQKIETRKKKIILFKSVMFDQILNLSPQDQLNWERLGKAWDFNTLLNTVEKKLEVLTELNRSILDEVNTQQNNKLNFLVFIFTVLSFITIALDVVDFVQQGLSIPNLIRTSIVGILTIILLVVIFRGKSWIFR